jgi:hypothetical protein
LAFGGFERVDDAAALADFKTRATQVPYMPGQAIIFFQHIVHYITKPTSAQKKMDRYRLLHGFYLMDGAEAPFDYTECIETQVPYVRINTATPQHLVNKAFYRKTLHV